jgi:uncharacterized protein (DUF2267 family)
MNRADFIKEVARQNQMNQHQAYRAVIAVMDTMRLVMSRGDFIEIGGFGDFRLDCDATKKKKPAFTSGRVLNRVVNTAAHMREKPYHKAKPNVGALIRKGITSRQNMTPEQRIAYENREKFLCYCELYNRRKISLEQFIELNQKLKW